MRMFDLKCGVIAALVLSTVLPLTTFAQDATEPDAAAIVLRLYRLEDLTRKLSGQIEELQFANRKLEEQLARLQPTPDLKSADPAKTAPPAAASTVKGVKKGDAFDPAAQPDAPGSPKPLGTTEPTPAGTATEPSGPLNLMTAGKTTPQAESTLPQGALTATPALDAQAATSTAKKGTDPKADWDAARALMAKKDYEPASAALRDFIATYPKDTRLPDAMLLLGDSEYRQKHFPEAAQQYLKIVQAFPASEPAPGALVKLGNALNGMGQKPQACATYAELGKRYPNAEAALKAQAEQGRKGAGC